MTRFWILVALALFAALLAGCAAPETEPTAGSVTLPTVTPVEADAEESTGKTVALPTVTPTSAAPIVSAVTAAQQAVLDRLTQRTPAPELTNEVWINSEPLQLADLRGKVVIVEFWTYG